MLKPDHAQAHQLRGALQMGGACEDLERAVLESAVALDLAGDGHKELVPTIHAQLALSKYRLSEPGEGPRTFHPTPSCYRLLLLSAPGTAVDCSPSRGAWVQVTLMGLEQA